MLLSKRADPPANELRAGMENMLKHVQHIRTLLGGRVKSGWRPRAPLGRKAPLSGLADRRAAGGRMQGCAARLTGEGVRARHWSL
jgi:hypothetical protein